MPDVLTQSISRSRRTAALSAICALALLGGCGGGGGGGPISTPAPSPSPSPSPTPTPTPTPTPSSNFNTQEFRTSDGPDFHNAITAWQGGNTGRGTIIAVVDSGIDSDSPEFVGRIHPNSADVAGTRGIDGTDDHGTHVALVAAAARDNRGILGIAYEAQVLALRADAPGTCSANGNDPSLSCEFNDADIARGVDVAVSSGARVVNLSLGGGSATQVLLDAVGRAASAGLVIVVAAGNGGDGSEPGIDPNQPDPFAASLLQAGGANVIIVGSNNDSGQFSSFSNRAGAAQGSFLTALGEDVCCLYQNGQLFVETINGSQFVTVFSGTSFSAPQVSGAVALLAQAFPNLTGRQIVEILLNSARDAGAAGADAVFGRGILDIARAFAPAGTTTIAGQSTAFGLNERVMIGSPAMGDALGGQTLQTIITDKYQRAYGFDLAGGLAGSTLVPRLRGAVERSGRHVAAQDPSLALAFQIADGRRDGGQAWAEPLRLSGEEARQAEVLAASIAARIAPGTQLGLAYAQGAGGLVAQLQGHAAPAFRIAPGARSDSGFFDASDAALALRQELGRWGLTLHASRGDARLAFAQRFEETLYRTRERYPTQSFGLALDRRGRALAATLGLSWMREEKTLLGAQLHPAIGAGGSDSVFVDATARLAIGADWTAGGEWRLGLTRAQPGGVIAGGSELLSQAWAFDLSRRNALASGDSLGLRISQPLRVERGGLRLDLPASYDYATETPGYAVQRLSLAPQGREVLGELAWQGPLPWGRGAASLFYRRQPGHYAEAPGDVGAMVSFDADF